MTEQDNKSGKKDLLIALLLLLPVFPVIPFFLAGKWAGNLGKKLGTERDWGNETVWLLLVGTCAGLVFLFPHIDFPLKMNTGCACVVLVPVAGLLAGYLYAGLKKAKWVSVLPLLVAAFVCLMRCIMEFAAGQTA